MSLEPKPGLVIRYDFLWKSEQEVGSEQGYKNRPCTIILTTKPKEDGGVEVVLCPITHTPPTGNETGVEIPRKVSGFLGLDHERSWVKTHEVNTVTWEKDLIPYGVVPAREGKWEFGFLPHALGKMIFDQVRENSKSKSLENIVRANP